MGVLAYSGLGLRGLTLAHADHPQPWEIPSVMGVLAYSGLGLRGLTLAHAGHPQPWEIPGVMGKSESTGLTSLPPTTYAAVGNTQCRVHLLYVCTFSITPALSHTTPSTYLIASSTPQQASYLLTPHHLCSSGEYTVRSAPTARMHVFNNPSFVTHDAQHLSYRVRDEHPLR